MNALQKYYRRWLVPLGVALFFFGPLALGQEDMTTIAPTDFDHPQRPAAIFKHDAHNEKADIEDCETCHHLYEDGNRIPDESSEDQSCAECHPVKSSGAVRPLRQAFHDNCIKCHQRQGKGPRLCGECHVR